MLQLNSYTERGGDHSENEDFVLYDFHSGVRMNRRICFLADGQGGRADGAEAARIACESALSVCKNQNWDHLFVASTWDAVFTEADRAVRNSCEGFTTLIGFAVGENTISGASVGDSKVFYHGATDRFIELTERQEKNPPIGDGCNRAAFFSLPEYQGTVLAVSDGVWKYSGFDALREAASAKEMEQIPQILRASLVSRQGTTLPDDFTILTARWH